MRSCDESKVSTILPSIIADICRLHIPVFRYEDLESASIDCHYDNTLTNLVNTHVRLRPDTACSYKREGGENTHFGNQTECSFANVLFHKIMNSFTIRIGGDICILYCRKVKCHHIGRELPGITASQPQRSNAREQQLHMRTVIVLSANNRMYEENSHGRTNKLELISTLYSVRSRLGYTAPERRLDSRTESQIVAENLVCTGVGADCGTRTYANTDMTTKGNDVPAPGGCDADLVRIFSQVGRHRVCPFVSTDWNPYVQVSESERDITTRT